jgi:hypothetical protein
MDLWFSTAVLSTPGTPPRLSTCTSHVETLTRVGHVVNDQNPQTIHVSTQRIANTGSGRLVRTLVVFHLESGEVQDVQVNGEQATGYVSPTTDSQDDIGTEATTTDRKKARLKSSGKERSDLAYSLQARSPVTNTAMSTLAPLGTIAVTRNRPCGLNVTITVRMARSLLHSSS